MDEPGRQIVYYEGELKPRLRDIGLEVRGPSSDQLDVDPYPLDLRYYYQGRVAKAIATFDAPTSGRYMVSARGAPENGASLAVGHDLASTISIVLWGIGLTLIALIAGAAIAGVTYNRRSRA